jgi:hypothetical protein
VKIFDKLIDRFRGVLIPFILIGAIVIMLGGGIIKIITDFIVRYGMEIIITLGTVVFVVPIIIMAITGWEIPGFLIFYDFIFGIVVLIMLAGASDSKHYQQEGGYNGCHGYQNSSNINKTYGYSNTFFTPINREKERNGGFTDKEVALKKQLIRKKLEKNKLLDTTIREEVTTNE